MSAGRRYELMLPDGRAVEAWVDAGDAISVEIEGETFRFAASELSDDLALLSDRRLLVSHPSFQGACELREVPRHATSSHAGAEAMELRAPFPGKVVKVLVTAPSTVEKGTPLVVLEAMKMEFTYSAPGPLRIEKVLVREGQQLDKGAAFFEYGT